MIYLAIEEHSEGRQTSTPYGCLLIKTAARSVQGGQLLQGRLRSRLSVGPRERRRPLAGGRQWPVTLSSRLGHACSLAALVRVGRGLRD